MVGSVRKLCRKFGFDVARYPGASARWPRIVGMLQAHDVDLVVDVGANEGQYATALLNNGYDRRILSFEPVSTVHELLGAAAARQQNWVVAERAAVGDAAGSVDIRVSKETDMSSLLPMTAVAETHLSSARTVETEAVPMVTLAEAVPWDGAGRVFVKSDTQGYEAQVLAGLGARIDQVVGLQLELSLVPVYQGQPSYLDMLRQVTASGFAPHFLVPGYYSRHYGRMLEFDAVFFREDPAKKEWAR